MTYNPNDPNRNRREIRGRDGMSGPTMAGIALALILGLGILIYAMNRDDRTASTTTSPPATTGQSQKAPSPSATPAPKNQ